MLRWAKHVLFFNLPISFSAGLLSFGWTQHAGIPNGHLFGIFSGSACFFLYNSHRFYKIRQQHGDPRFHWLLLFICIGSLTSSMLYLPFLLGGILKKITAFFPAFVLAAFYLLPDGKRGLRNIPFLKAPIVSLTWTYLLIAAPLILTNHFKGTYTICLVGFWLFFLALTLPFDLRDKFIDSPQLYTLPMVLGNRSTNGLGITLALGSWLLLFQQFPILAWKWTLSAHTIVLILLMIWPIKWRNDLYYIGLDLMPGALGTLFFLNET